MGRCCGESGKLLFTRKEAERRLRYSFPPCPAIALATADLSLSRKAGYSLKYNT